MNASNAAAELRELECPLTLHSVRPKVVCRSGMLLAVLLILVLPTLAIAQTDFARPAESDNFLADTRQSQTTSTGGSADFLVDTRAIEPERIIVDSGWSMFEINTLSGAPSPLTVTGRIWSSTGASLSGVSIEIKIYGQAWWRGVSGPDGSFYPPEMKAQNYVVTAQKTGFVTLAKNVAGSAGGVSSLSLVMIPLTTAPSTETVNRDATTGEKFDPGGQVQTSQIGQPEKQLLIYGSGAWHVVGDPDSPVVNTNAMTVVLSHGWTKSPWDWPLTMALLVSQNNTLAGQLNILAWNWQTEASTFLPWPDRATKQGEALGYALRRRLGFDYSQRIHFIGHSMGTLVNRFACDKVHQRGTMDGGEIGWDPAQTKPQMTLLDEAELTSVLGTRIFTSATIGGAVAGWYGALYEAAKTTYQDWKSPVPTTPTSLVDNYISMVGIQRYNAVNVCLTAPAVGSMNPIDAHAYAHQWYRNSAQSPFSPVLGFTQSFERGGTLPPSAYGLSTGSVWYENLDTPSPLDLFLHPDPTSLEANLTILGAYFDNYAIRPAATIGKLGLDGEIAVVNTGLSVTNAVLKGYDASINWVGDIGGTGIITGKQVYATTVEKLGEGWDAASDKAVDVINNLNPTRIIDRVSRSIFQIHLGGGGSSGGFRAASSASTPSVTEPSAWFSLEIPADAATMQFDFTVTGPPVDDCIAAAVAGQNVFDLPARFAPQGQVQSTDMIDVSAFAGQTVEFYFGLVGGTSTTCELVIDGLRFITIPMPKLILEDHGAKVSLHWPAAASGWVLEASESLVGDSWQEVLAGPGSFTAFGGVNRLEEPKPATTQFYRLRRVN